MQSNGDHFRQSYLFILNVTWMEGIAFKYQDSSVCFAPLDCWPHTQPFGLMVRESEIFMMRETSYRLLLPAGII